MVPDRLGGIRDGLLPALREALPGLELVDRDLDLGEGRRVDLVGLDGAGRVVALLFVESEGEAPVLRALDALAWLGRNRRPLADHLESARLDPDLEPIVVLLSETYDERLLGRLAGLNREAVRCFEMRRVVSKRGERVYLVPAALPRGAGAAVDPTGSRALLRALAPEAAVLAEELVRRVDRVDEELERAPDGTGIAWSFGGAPLCDLRASRGALEGRVGGASPEPLRTAQDAEQFVEAVLARFRSLLGPAGAGREPAGDPEGDDEPAAAAFDPTAPILTAEEIAAFQEP